MPDQNKTTQSNPNQPVKAGTPQATAPATPPSVKTAGQPVGFTGKLKVFQS